MGRSNWNKTAFKNILIYVIPSGYEEGSYDREDYMNEFPEFFENKTKDEIDDYFELVKLQQFKSIISAYSNKKYKGEIKINGCLNFTADGKSVLGYIPEEAKLTNSL